MNCVLLGERHHDLGEGVRGLLETAFNAVFLVADQPSLVSGAARLQPTLVVVDLALAGGDLPGLVAALRRQAPAAKVLVLSVHDEPVVVETVKAADVDGFVLKRAIGSELLPAVDAVLSGQRFVSTSAAA